MMSIIHARLASNASLALRAGASATGAVINAISYLLRVSRVRRRAERPRDELYVPCRDESTPI